MHRPLADEIRPGTLDEVVGQRHLLAPGAVLRRIVEQGTDANMVFYGPSGTGKGTICKELVKDNKIMLSVSMTSSATSSCMIAITAFV